MVKQDVATQPDASEPAPAASRFVAVRHSGNTRTRVAPGPAPLVLDVGKRKRKAIKELKRGRGKLMLEIEQVVEDVRQGLAADARGKEIVPVVLIYRQRPRRRGRLL